MDTSQNHLMRALAVGGAGLALGLLLTRDRDRRREPRTSN